MTLLLVGCLAAPAGAAEAGGTVAVWWQPPGDPPPAARVHAAFEAAAARLGAPLVDASEPAAAPPSLAPALQAAMADYAAFRFADALFRLDEVARLADARGGGDLDDRQLSQIYLYRGLSRLEVGPADAAWDDLVRAARLDPSRVIDPARFPPRMVSVWRRAQAEAAELPRASLEVERPADATLIVDGREATTPASVIVGPHFVRVTAPGYEPWAAVVAVSAGGERLHPPLRAYQPPDGDRLLALTRARNPRRVLLGAVERAGGGWRFVARRLSLPDGQTVSDAAALDGQPASLAVAGVVRRLAPLEAVATPLPPPPKKTRWWPWALAGGVAAALAVVIPVSIVYAPSSPSVGGSVGPLR